MKIYPSYEEKEKRKIRMNILETSSRRKKLRPQMAQGQSKSEGNTPRGRTKGSQRKKNGQVKPFRILERPSEAGIPPFQVGNAFKKGSQTVSREKTSPKERTPVDKKIPDRPTAVANGEEGYGARSG